MKVINTVVLIVSIHFVSVAAQNTVIKTVNIPAGSEGTLTCEWPNEIFQVFQIITWKRRNEVLLTCRSIQDCNTERRTRALNDSYSVSSHESPLKSTLTISSVSATDSLYTCSIITFRFGHNCVFNINITGKKIDEQFTMLQGCFDGIIMGERILYVVGGLIRNSYNMTKSCPNNHVNLFQNKSYSIIYLSLKPLKHE